MIHEILPHQFDNKFQGGLDFSDDDYILYFRDNSVLLKFEDDDFRVPRKKELAGIPSDTKYSFLFTLDKASCFLIWDLQVILPDKFIFKEINFLRTFKKKELAWICMVGYQLMNWYTINRYCGKCGAANIEKNDERALICSTCNTVVFPKISPAIIVAILDKDKILLANNSNFANNWYSLVAGYADIGESLEETVIREVKEEVGIDIKNIRYYKSQPWPFSGSMMIGFIAEADSSQAIQIDNKEITEAAWFSRGNLPNHPTSFSIAGELIEKFEKGEL